MAAYNIIRYKDITKQTKLKESCTDLSDVIQDVAIRKNVNKGMK